MVQEGPAGAAPWNCRRSGGAASRNGRGSGRRSPWSCRGDWGATSPPIACIHWIILQIITGKLEKQPETNTAGTAGRDP